MLLCEVSSFSDDLASKGQVGFFFFPSSGWSC